MNIYLISNESFRLINDEIKKIVKDNSYEIFNLNKSSIKEVIEEIAKESLNIEMFIGMDIKENKDKFISYFSLLEEGKKLIEQGNKDFLNAKINIEELNTENFYHYLFQDLPPIDLMIRTSGEVRVSNFMLYQIAYAEMYFPKVYFPDFNEKEFDKALDVYNKRDRRFGGIKK